MPDTVMTEASEPEMLIQGPRQRSRQWGDLMTALAKAQGEIEGASKRSNNPHFNRKYADLASVWEAIREPLAKHGLAIMQWPRAVQNGVEIETTIAHGEQFISDVLWMPCGKMDAHGIGSAITYGRRYALMAVVGVAPEDDDGNGASEGYKPAAGSGGAGGDFRPDGPRMPTRNYVNDAKHDGIVDETRKKGTLPGPKKSAVEKVKEWNDRAIETLNLSAHTVDSLSKFLSDNNEKIDWMEANAPDEHERFFAAYNAAAEAARARVPA